MKNKITLFLIFSISICFAQVGISTTSPHISAELDVSSNSRGLLLPRLRTTAINALSATASEGLVVFNKDTKQFLGWDGTSWQVLGNVPITVTFADWDFSNLTSGGPSPLPASSINQINSATLIKGTGLGIPGANGVYGANGFNSLDLATAISNSDFFTIPISLYSVSIFSFSKIAANNLRRSTNGPQNFQWQYSLDNASYINIGSAINLPSDLGAGNDVPEIDLSSISALQNLTNTTIYLRLVGYNPLMITGTGFINDMSGKDLQIIGTYR